MLLFNRIGYGTGKRKKRESFSRPIIMIVQEDFCMAGRKTWFSSKDQPVSSIVLTLVVFFLFIGSIIFSYFLLRDENPDNNWLWFTLDNTFFRHYKSNMEVYSFLAFSISVTCLVAVIMGVVRRLIEFLGEKGRAALHRNASNAVRLVLYNNRRFRLFHYIGLSVPLLLVIIFFMNGKPSLHTPVLFGGLFLSSFSYVLFNRAKNDCFVSRIAIEFTFAGQRAGRRLRNKYSGEDNYGYVYFPILLIVIAGNLFFLGADAARLLFVIPMRSFMHLSYISTYVVFFTPLFMLFAEIINDMYVI